MMARPCGPAHHAHMAPGVPTSTAADGSKGGFVTNKSTRPRNDCFKPSMRSVFTANTADDGRPLAAPALSVVSIATGLMSVALCSEKMYKLIISSLIHGQIGFLLELHLITERVRQ